MEVIEECETMTKTAVRGWAAAKYAGKAPPKATRCAHMVRRIVTVGLVAIEWRVGSPGGVPE